MLSDDLLFRKQPAVFYRRDVLQVALSVVAPFHPGFTGTQRGKGKEIPRRHGALRN